MSVLDFCETSWSSGQLNGELAAEFLLLRPSQPPDRSSLSVASFVRLGSCVSVAGLASCGTLLGSVSVQAELTLGKRLSVRASVMSMWQPTSVWARTLQPLEAPLCPRH